MSTTVRKWLVAGASAISVGGVVLWLLVPPGQEQGQKQRAPSDNADLVSRPDAAELATSNSDDATSTSSRQERTEPPVDLRDDFKPGDFERIYPTLVESNVQEDRDKAARLIMFYGNLILEDRLKTNGEITLDDTKVVHSLYREHAQRHPGLLTNFQFVRELLQQSVALEDFDTAAAVFETLQQTHPEQLEQDFPCFQAKLFMAAPEADPAPIKAMIEACDDEQEAQMLVVDYVGKLFRRDGAAAANAEYRVYSERYPGLPRDLRFPE